jgi:hypothetical protein
MLKKLAKIANRLDSMGLTKEADTIDGLIKRFAQDMSSLSDQVLEEELNYIVPVRMDDWNWVIPLCWSGLSSNNNSPEGMRKAHNDVDTAAGMAASIIKRRCDKVGCDFKSSCDRFIELGKSSLEDYIEHVSDKQAYVDSANMKWTKCVRAFKKACEDMMMDDVLNSESMMKREVEMESEGNPF